MNQKKQEILEKIRFEMQAFKDAFPYSYSRIEEHLKELEREDYPTQLPDISAEELDEDMEIYRSTRKYK